MEDLPLKSGAALPLAKTWCALQRLMLHAQHGPWKDHNHVSRQLIDVGFPVLGIVVAALCS
jgi:hypothetical protein